MISLKQDWDNWYSNVFWPASSRVRDALEVSFKKRWLILRLVPPFAVVDGPNAQFGLEITSAAATFIWFGAGMNWAAAAFNFVGGGLVTDKGGWNKVWWLGEMQRAQRTSFVHTGNCCWSCCCSWCCSKRLKMTQNDSGWLKQTKCMQKLTWNDSKY